MKALSIREIRAELPKLEELLAAEGEVMLTRHGRAIARLVPVRSAGAVSSHADLRARMRKLKEGSETLVRADRDAR